MASNLILPLGFGERPCDRLLSASLSLPPESSLGLMLRVWRDFAIARDDRRSVPRDPEARASSAAVRIIESFIGWTGEPGAFVAAGVAAGFFTLLPIDEVNCQLVLVDFFPANRSGALDLSASRLGGTAKSVNSAIRKAKAGADEQLDFLRQSGHDLLRGRAEKDVSAGLLFIHQLCNVLKQPVPQAKEWKEELLVKALDVKSGHDAAAIDRTFRWLVLHRGSQEIPDRIDFVLNAFPDFAARAAREIKS